jgi:drug/metabolite transporter (DMT)-like permease
MLCVPAMAAGTLLFEGLPAHWPSRGVTIATLYVGVAPMATGTAIWFALVKLLPTQVAALAAIAVPIVAVLSGVIFLHEPLSALQAAAISSTVISLWLALVPRSSVG